MRLPEALDKISRALRSAVLGGDYVVAERLVSEYTVAAGELWESLPEPARTSSAIPGQTKELIEWARAMVVIQRAMAAEQLVVIQKASRYSIVRSAESPIPGVQFRG